ncbi:hypothetical protein M9458_051010 [Cirrhinus mrigala]|uniref:Uncharacterized protein n=1 Tax=Cirrhinus mrigala TaxID=683832 RepID=A0ABD0MXB4_CIRMR
MAHVWFMSVVQVRLPVYLEDYDHTATRRRQVSSPTRPHAAEESRRVDDARISPSPYDRAFSPVSQYSWHVVDEWSSATFNREHSDKRQQVRAPSQSKAPLPSAQPAQFSPFHRPWEESESQSSPQTVINTSHRPSQPLVHSESLPTPLPYSSTIRQSLQLADTVAAPVTSVPSFHEGDYSSLPTPKQAVGYRDYSVLPRHLDRNAESSHREHVLVEFLDESVRPTSHRLALPPTAYSNYPHDPSWYPEQRFEPLRAAHLPHPHESYERRRPGYLTPMHRTSAMHPDDRENTYSSPTPSITDFITGDPSEFTRLKIALEILLPPDATELFRYQILMDHLRLDEARLVADSYLKSPFPYSDTTAALTERFGQPYKLALRRIAKVMDAPDIPRGDTASFDSLPCKSDPLSSMPYLQVRSTKLDLWLSQNKADPQESTLGLSWHCESDQLGFKHRPVTYNALMMRSIYRVLASQYDPLGVILPYTTRAKVIVQQLWMTHQDWDDPQLPSELQRAWTAWEEELKYLPQVTLPRCYNPSYMDHSDVRHEIHIFSDASEKAYGAVAYLLSEGAQLAKLLANELTLKVDKITYWTDSTIVHWLHSESCRYKVSVGTRIAEIRELTNQAEWHYVNSEGNPADDLTRGKSLWLQGPKFLLQPQEDVHDSEDTIELKGGTFCGITITMPLISDGKEYIRWTDLVEAVAQDDSPPASTYREAETVILRRIQMDSFPEDYRLLKTNKPVCSENQLIRVGGRLRQAETLDPHTMHPIVLDPHHPNTQLLIKDTRLKDTVTLDFITQELSECLLSSTGECGF